ncbi:MAG: peptidoglycan bridge formation glycyltransferase FemA/FemB family protein [Fermentimonas sp.]|nr:peptidoglycan bridge formation glycyltransferase FemA/FemB family protein [Fermentimonas sp.]MDD4696300.1 peptidoglycan bridge formation glycyltransferase FemA/FemB family protein [Fermentimonas sp.]
MNMIEHVVKTYYRKEDLPELNDVNFFHYSSSFDWYSNSSAYTPFMIVAFDEKKPIAAVFAFIVRRNSFLRGSIFKRCFVSQQPSFFDESYPKTDLFNLLIKHIVHEVKNKVFLIRYDTINSTTFGYKGFRENRFYSTKWINIKNSLQKKRKIWEQLSTSRKNQVNKAIRKGVKIDEFNSEDNLPEIYKLIETTKNKKISHRFPPYQYFENFYRYYILNGKGKILLTRYQNKIIGGAILGFEDKKTVYCLYYWGKSKRYKNLFPTIFTLYSAMHLAEDKGFEFFDFMDVGYINKNTGRPRFLLQFGGKQSATRRWYRYNWGLFNFLANKFHD